MRAQADVEIDFGQILNIHPLNRIFCEDRIFAEYFDNRFLEGVPVFVRCEGAIDYNWQQGSPDASVPVDDFSVRWTGIFPFEDGNYLFFMLTDDGAKIYVDGNVAFNAWLDQAVKAYSVNVPMTVGQHEIRYEYYEHTVNAEFHASWIKL